MKLRDILGERKEYLKGKFHELEINRKHILRDICGAIIELKKV
jgi:predicted RNA-binding protein